MRKVFENVLDYNDFKIKVKQEIRKGETNNEIRICEGNYEKFFE